jgi:spore coat protein U-like protein
VDAQSLERNITMNMKKTSLLALALAASLAGTSAMAAEDTSTMTVSATLVTACEVSPTSSIAFGNITALLSTGDQSADTAGSFTVACSNSATPTIYATGTRSMSNGTHSLPFNLSLTAGAAADDLPSILANAIAITPITQDGAMQPMTIHGSVAATDFQDISSGAYTANITVAVVY